MGAGPRLTAIGYAVGREGMRLRGDTDAGKVVAVVGDGAMTGGVAFEAIHQAGGLGTPIVVVLNDNGMSIAPNVGAMSRYFNRVRLNLKPWHAREGVEGRLAELPGSIGAAFERLAAAQGVDQGSGPRACSGPSWTGPTWASSTATTSARPAGRRGTRLPLTGPSWCRRHLAAVAAASPWPRTAASRAWRSGTRPPKSIANGVLRPRRCPRPPNPPCRSTRPCSARR